MVLHHTYYPEIQGVYELWFHIFEERLIARERQKKKKKEIDIKKEKAPYIITSKIEENELSASILSDKKNMIPIIISKINEESLSNIC